MVNQAVIAYGAGDLRVESHETRELAPDAVRVDVVYGGICGSDLHYANHGANGDYRIQEPLVLGHEIVGYVGAVGEAVGPEVSVGSPVAVHPATPSPGPDAARVTGLHLTPGGAYLGSAATVPHTQGGFQGSLVVRPDQLRVIPEGLPLRRAVLAEPLAIALHGVDRVRDRIAGARVLVSGAGPIGALVIASLRERGATHITAADIQEFPLGVAAKVGADATVNLSHSSVGDGEFDLVFECSGVAPSFAAALDSVRPGGAIVQVGILPARDVPTAVWKLQSREIALFGSQRFDNELGEALDVLARRPELDAVVTAEYPIADALEAFAEAADSSRSSKVILRLADARV
jgi:threonine dehydrogenase-like Zn-dependent dehydrogenase